MNIRKIPKDEPLKEGELYVHFYEGVKDGDDHGLQGPYFGPVTYLKYEKGSFLLGHPEGEDRVPMRDGTADYDGVSYAGFCAHIANKDDTGV